MPGFGGWLGLQYDRHSLLSPALRGVVSHFARNDFEATGGQADFTLNELLFQVCPLHFGWRSFALEPCAAGGLDLLSDRGRNTVEPRTYEHAFAIVGGSAVLMLDLGHYFGFTGFFNALFPLKYYRFKLGDELLHETTPLTLQAGIGVQGRFP
jgi:hypothetical protein